jgi:hypothetical protein
VDTERRATSYRANFHPKGSATVTAYTVPTVEAGGSAEPHLFEVVF